MKLDRELLEAAAYDDRGVPLVGRHAELSALRRAGYDDLSRGRIYEGHVNALGLIARFGTPEQRARAYDDCARGSLFGVWNTQDGRPVRIVASGARFTLVGEKSWASGATFVERPIVTAAWPDGSLQMCVVPMETVRPAIDRSAWMPHGMHDSQSYLVDFDRTTLGSEALLGAPNDYTRAPWFFGGAIRFTAVQTGAVERLIDETARYLVDLGRERDLVQTMRLGEMDAAGRTARAALAGGAEAWHAFDLAERDGAEATQSARASDVVVSADYARVVVERAALDVIERAMRAVGARGLLEPLPFGRLVRDLQMYLRQPAPDAALERLGRAAFDAASARRHPAGMP